MTKKIDDGYVQDKSGLLVRRDDLEVFVKLQDDEDAIAAARREVTGVELETFAYEFVSKSDGRNQTGLAIGGVEYLYEHEFKILPSFGDPQVLVQEVPQEESRAFTVAIIATGKNGRRAPGISTQIDRPLRQGSRTERYFDRFAAPKALTCARRNATRDLIPKVKRQKFLQEVLNAKHGVGRVQVLNQPRKQIERAVVQEWAIVNSSLHAELRKLGLNKDGLHAVMKRAESKYLKRSIETFNAIPAKRLQVWVKLLKVCGKDSVEFAKLKKNVDRATPAQPKKRSR